MPENKLILSSVTTCMNRASSIKKTLPYNLNSSKNYKNAIFTLVNYGSTDDLEEFVKTNLMNYIEDNKLKYVKVLDKIDFFHHAKAKNIGIKASNADLIFNSDAEWYSNESLFDLIFNEFTTNEEKKTLHIGGRGGALVNYKKHIEMVRGYDESMVGWGFEDSDLFNRLRYGFNFEHKRSTFDPYCMLMRRAHPPRDNRCVPENKRKNNRSIHAENISKQKFVVNEENKWGNAEVLINFKDRVLL